MTSSTDALVTVLVISGFLAFAVGTFTTTDRGRRWLERFGNWIWR